MGLLTGVVILDALLHNLLVAPVHEQSHVILRCVGMDDALERLNKQELVLARVGG